MHYRSTWHKLFIMRKTMCKLFFPAHEKQKCQGLQPETCGFVGSSNNCPIGNYESAFALSDRRELGKSANPRGRVDNK